MNYCPHTGESCQSTGCANGLCALSSQQPLIHTNNEPILHHVVLPASNSVSVRAALFADFIKFNKLRVVYNMWVDKDENRYSSADLYRLFEQKKFQVTEI